jgi:hypothetical protein
MFDDFANDILKTEVKPKHKKSGYLKKCRGVALLTKISELAAGSNIGRAAIFDMVVLSVAPTDPKDPTNTNTEGEAVSKWFKFEDGDAKKRSAIKGDFKRQLCSIFSVDPSTMTAEQYKAMGQAAANGSCEGMLIQFEPRTSDKGMTFHDFYAAPGKNSPADVAKRIKAYNDGAALKDLL